MAEEESKKDELLVMRLIGEGKNRMKDLRKSLKWSQERLEETIDHLQKGEYIKVAQKTGDRVLKITERGRKELPKLLGEVAKESREFIETFSDSFEKIFNNVFPNVSVDVNIEETEGEQESYTCKKCGQEFSSERALEIHKGSEH